MIFNSQHCQDCTTAAAWIFTKSPSEKQICPLKGELECSVINKMIQTVQVHWLSNDPEIIYFLLIRSLLITDVEMLIEEEMRGKFENRVL